MVNNIGIILYSFPSFTLHIIKCLQNISRIRDSLLLGCDFGLNYYHFSSAVASGKWNCCCCSVAKSHQTLCDLMDCSKSGSSVLHHLPEFCPICVHWVSNEKWSISCHISKQGCHHYQRLQPSNVSWWALRELKKENTCCLTATRLQPLSTVSPEERKFRVWKYRILTPDSWGSYERNDFSEPRLLHPSIHKKVLINSLTWDIWFSLINNNLWKRR